MMHALQGPVPPVPPVPPGSEMSVTGSLEGIAAVVLLLGAGLIVAALLWPLIRALARRIEGGAPSTEMQAELEGLRERVRQLEEMQPRMAELEERVDFTERIVAQGREPDRIQR
jgi:Tfp pilus assembly protein PilO